MIPNMSDSRVESADDMVVDGQGFDPPSDEWLRSHPRGEDIPTKLP